MMKRSALLRFLLLLGASTPLCAAPPPWPQDHSDLIADPKAVFGHTGSGVRYVIVPNQEPPGRASLRLYMNVGSLMEDDDQQGMAHFLEHMAFNGSKNFPAGQLVEYLQHLGMGFGADTNAHTSFKETVYQLELPKVEESLMADGLKLFNDYLGNLLLDQKEIDKERGVILSEKLARDSVDERTMRDGFKFAMPDAKISSRMPIGLTETIQKMNRPRFADLYDTYYTPDRAVVVVVGDVDVAMVKKNIEKAFADAKARRGEAADPDFGKVTQGRGLVAKLHTEMEAPATDISIETLRSASTQPDSAGRRRELMVRELADMMLNQRLVKLEKAENAAILGGESYGYEYLKFVRVDGIQAKAKPERWKEALTLIEQELRRAVEHGFTDAEFDEAKAGALNAAQLRAQQAKTRKSRELASGLVGLLAADKVYTDPEADLKRVAASLAVLKKSDCHAALAKAWDTKDVSVFVGGNLKIEGDSAKAILDVYNASHAKAVTAPANEKTGAFAYTEFGAPGKIAKRTVVKDLDITEATFENHVHVSIKHTPFEENSARVLISFGGGKLEAPKDKPGIIGLAQSIFHAGGLEKHSADDLRRLFAGKTVGVDFSVGDEAFLLGGRTTPKDLDSELDLLTAYLSAAGFRAEAERQFRANLDSMYQELEHTAEGIMADKVVAFIHSNDPRFGIASRAETEKRTTAEVKSWLAQPLAEGYLEVSVVGDVDVEKALASIGRTLGALPVRADKKPAFTEGRVVKFPAEPKKKDFHFTSEIERSYALIYWPTTDMASDIRRSRRLSLLAQILDDRLRIKIREDLGESYSPVAYHLPSDTFPGYGYVTSMITLKPESVAKVGPIVTKIGDDLAAGPITEDEFDRAKKPLLAQIEQQRRDNRYWSQTVLRCCQEHPERLDWSRSMIDDFTSIKREDMEALAKEFLMSGSALSVSIVPDEKK